MNKKSCVVIIPIYKQGLSENETFAFNNNIKVLRNHQISIVCPFFLRSYSLNLLQSLGVHKPLIKCFPGSYFKSIAGYNKLLMSIEFYEAYSDFSHLLVCQTDAVVFDDRLDRWLDLDYSYIGAPWFVGMSKPIKPLKFMGVGNGGLSLRRIADFIKFLRIPARLSIDLFYSKNLLVNALRFIKHKIVFSYNSPYFLPRVNEDYFWGVLVSKRCDFFKIPEPLKAAEFAFEVEPSFLYFAINEKLPFGCHAWEKYDKKFWIKIFENREMIGYH